jgi:hypothetical protein
MGHVGKASTEGDKKEYKEHRIRGTPDQLLMASVFLIFLVFLVLLFL